MKTRFLLATALVAGAAFAQSAEHWVGTWAASPQQPRVAVAPAKPAVQTVQITPGQVTVGQGPGGQTIQAGIQVQGSIIPGGPAAPQAAAPAGGPPAPPPGAFNNQTIRMIVHTSIGGRRARVQLSNGHGTVPLMIGAAHIALRAKGSEIVAGSDRALSFSGKPAAWIPVGAAVVSDPVDLSVPADSDLAVSVYVPGDSGPATMHATGLHTNYISNPGNFTAEASIADARTAQSWYWLSSVEVLAPADTSALVAFGDSITDGARSTPDTDRSWPSQLAKRLKENGVTNVAVLNHGISGNRVLRDGAGINALARFDRDVLAMPGVKWVMFLEGINDIGQGARANANPNDAVDADMLIGAMKQLIERSHAHGIKVIGCTVLPYEGAAYYSENGEVIRQAVNQFIRSGAFDAVVDFDAVTRDPANPKRFRAEHDSGDHLHPGDAGYKAMAEAIDLSMFGARK